MINMQTYPENINPAAFKLLDKWLARRQTPTRIIELGCNLGTFGKTVLMRYKMQEIEWHGVDINKSALKVARRRLTSASYMDLDNAKKADIVRLLMGSPDIIIMIDTLEHIKDPSRLMSLLLTAFPTASLLAVLPNIGCLSIIEMLGNGRFDYAQHGILDNTHLKHFTVESAIDFFRRHGYPISSEIEWLVEPKYAHYLSEKGSPVCLQAGNITVDIKSRQQLISLCSYGYGMIFEPR